MIRDNIYDLEPPPLLYEVGPAVNKLQWGKALGINGISLELLKQSGEMILKVLHNLVCKIWITCEWPVD